MRNLDALVDALTTELDALDAAREDALPLSREVVRASGTAIKLLHRGEDATPALDAARSAADRLRDAVQGKPGLESAGFTEQAYQELVEAHLVEAVVLGREFPSADALRVPPAAYALGLGDLVGELRRMALNAMVTGDVDAAKRHLDAMDDVYEALLRFDYPSALVDVRRKQDAARGMLERTRGEIAVALRGRRLEEKIDRLTDMLEELEDGDGKKRPAPRAKKARAEDDVPDVDKVW